MFAALEKAYDSFYAPPIKQGFYDASSDALAYYDTAQINAKTLPNMLLAGDGITSGLDKSIIQTINEVGQHYKPPAIPYSDKILVPKISPDLTAMAAQCQGKSLNQLIASQDPDSYIHCGWLYKKPPPGGAIPPVSRGFLGTESGPIIALNPGSNHNRWFFDLEEAKRETLLDKCNSLKTCTDVDSSTYSGDCGYCKDTYQGVPIDSHGNSLYSSDPRGGCSSVVRKASACPPPPPPNAGPQPVRDATCDPINGQLTRACMKRHVLLAGCSDSGALALALSGNVQNQNDYMHGLRNTDTVKVYNRLSNPPINLDIFSQGRTTINDVLREAQQLKANTAQSSSSGIGAGARDLCLRRGFFDQYDVCAELSDGVPTPLPLKCLQNEFLKMGGRRRAIKYPTDANLSRYNSMGSLGAIKQYWQGRLDKMGRSDNFINYGEQKSAVSDMLGIELDNQIKRAPYSQGVEVFWFVLVPGDATRVIGFLKRTIEDDFVQLRPGGSGISQLGGLSYGCMAQLTDVRARQNFTTKFSVNIDDGFWIAVNQPANIDRSEMVWGAKDVPGLFRNNNMQGPTWYTSSSITPFSASKPNIVKMFFQDGGGGWNAFQLDMKVQSGPSSFEKQYYSLTCEENAPFLRYEVSPTTGKFEEQRNPGLFGQFLILTQLESHLRPEEANDVPGKKQFVRLNSSKSCIDMPNIAFQSWKSMTFLIRFATMPIKETIIMMLSGGYYCNVVAHNGGSVTIESNFGGGHTVIKTPWGIQLNTWHLFTVYNNGTGLHLFCNWASSAANGEGLGSDVQIENGKGFYAKNATWNPTPGQNGQACSIIIGPGHFTGRFESSYSTSAFQFDVGWVHFFDTQIENDTVTREAKADWIYTEFPTSYNNYSTS